MSQHLYFLRHGDVQRIPSFSAEKDYPDYPLYSIRESFRLTYHPGGLYNIELFSS